MLGANVYKLHHIRGIVCMENGLRGTCLPACLVIAFTTLSNAHAQTLPRYDVDGYCKEIASATGEYSASTDQLCFEAEQDSYNNVKSVWAGLPEAARRYCDDIATFTGKGSYKTLAYCLKQESAAAGGNANRKFDWGDDSADGGASADAPVQQNEGHSNAMHHFASARALAHLCPVMEINADYVDLMATLVGVDLSPAGADFAIMDKDMAGQIAQLKETMKEAGDGAEVIICAVAQNLYGPTGSNVKNLLKVID